MTSLSESSKPGTAPPSPGGSEPNAGGLHPLLAGRWSPRAFDASLELDDAAVRLLLEAARWSPSSSNTQPWRFAVTRRGTPEHAALVGTLTGSNRDWAPAASLLLVAAAAVVAPDGTPRRWAAYDTGQAVAHLSVQASAMGLVVHQMGGYDVGAVTRLLGLGADVVPMTVVAVGRHDPTALLPEKLAVRETQPRTRRDVEELVLAVSAGSSADRS